MSGEFYPWTHLMRLMDSPSLNGDPVGALEWVHVGF
jgi:hypothetical protein